MGNPFRGKGRTRRFPGKSFHASFNSNISAMNKKFTCEEARQMDLVEYLATLGFIGVDRFCLGCS
jgi:hypothetical protein